LQIPAQLRQSLGTLPQNKNKNKNKRAEGVAQMVRHLPQLLEDINYWKT
jgi:hypothetical protein